MHLGRRSSSLSSSSRLLRALWALRIQKAGLVSALALAVWAGCPSHQVCMISRLYRPPTSQGSFTKLWRRWMAGQAK
ncbi:hypothetical protein C8R45DRAFT_1025294 [Mycena sanguinolenta]|nr:hypothetical protein C8R45DRAFT_1025294 [Mycena sanguinolenta]